MATDPNFKGREQLFKNKGKDVDVSCFLLSLPYPEIEF